MVNNCNIFINNENINILLLCHEGYYYEYNNQKNLGDFVPKCKKLFAIFNLKSNLNDETKKILENGLQLLN